MAITPGPPYRVLVAAHDPLARRGIAALLTASAEIELAGESDRGDALRLAALELAPDLIVLDLGEETELEEAELEIDTPVLALLDDVSAAEDLLHVPVRGVLARDGSAERLRAAVVAVVEELLVLDPEARRSWDRPRVPPAAAVERLTGREEQVLALMAEGLSNRELAEALGISEHTAKFHVNAILSKLGAASRTEAVVRAARQGLLRI
jgi:DNA-binding NarL/FixJ family response regulator